MKGDFRRATPRGRAVWRVIGTVAAVLMIATTAHGEPMVALAHNRPAAAIQNAVVGTADGSRQLKLTISLKPQAAVALSQLLADLQNPASPRYHRWLSGSEFMARFGPAPATVASVVQWLVAQGFSVGTGDRQSGRIEFSGSVAAVQRAFQTTIATYGDGSVYANLDEPRIPARLAGIIGAIGGMDNMSRVVPATSGLGAATSITVPALTALGRRLALPAEQDGGATPLAIIPPARAAFAPSDFYTFYDEPAAARAIGGPECVAIVGNSNYLPAALTLFNSQFNLPNVAPSQKLVDGSNPGIGTGEIEALLDLQWSHAVAPQAPQLFYLDNPTTGSLVDAIAAAVQDNLCRVISISFDFCGLPDNFFTGTLDPLFAQAAAQGQSVFVAAGDWGAANLVFDPIPNGCVVATSRNVNEMAADPNVTAVGGSEFEPVYDGSGNDVGFVSERVYNDSDEPLASAGGGGASAIFAKPSYQSGPGVPADKARDLPDVALMASAYQPGAYFGNDNNGSPAIGCCAGGTSLAAPLWAGAAWLLSYQAGTRLGNLNPSIYGRAAAGQAAAGFRDITTGDNGFNGVAGFQAGAGYDLATGWGTLDVGDLLSAFAGFPTPTPSPTASATATPSPSPSTTPSVTSSPTSSASPTPTPSPTPAPTTTPSPSPAPTRSPSPTATPTPTLSPSASPSPSPTSIPTPTRTTMPTASPSPTQMPTPTPILSPAPTPAPSGSATPVPGGGVSGAASADVAAVPGQTVVIGTFTLTTNPGLSQQIDSLTIAVSNPSMFQSLTLSAITAGGTRSVTLSVPGANSVFAFQPPLALAGGAAAQFVLQGLIAGP